VTYLLDTNAVSEITRPRPDPGFQAWMATVRPGDSYLSVLTVGELRRGIANLPGGRRRDLLESLNRELVEGFEGRVLPITVEIANLWGDMSGLARNRGRAIAVVDGLIAATAIVHDLTVVTRNLWDFDPTECRMLCPWDQGPSAG
jgi:toxin FitB